MIRWTTSGDQRRWLQRASATAVTIAVVSACGIPMQDTARPLPSGALATPTAAVAVPNGRAMDLYFVSGRDLEAVKEVVVDRSANGIMAAILAGPPADRTSELRTLLRDPLTGGPMLAVTSISPAGQVSLMATPAFAQLPATDQVLLLGQVSLSLDEIGLSSIAVTDSVGAPLALPLPDGRALVGPATAADYSSLVPAV